MAALNKDVDVGVTESTTFSIAGKQIKFNSAEDIAPYVQQLAAQDGVRKIDISGNTIGIDASEVFAAAILKHKTTLVEVDFSDIYTGRLNTEIPQSLQHLLPALLQCADLKVVNLSDNAFGLQTIDPIEEYLAKAVSVEHLILSNNGMGPFAGARIGKSLFQLSLAKKQQKYPSLKTFICGRNRLENGSINYLAIGLRAHEHLHTVRLYQNGIRPAGIEKLILQGLARNSHLQVLDLQDNTLTTRAAIALAELLSAWDSLVELNLNDCLLKPKGSLALADHLANGSVKSKFETLKLQYNELEADALKRLVRAVSEKLPHLKTLELNGNRFDEEAEEIDAFNSVFEARGHGELDELDELEELDSDEENEDDDEDDEDTFDGAAADLNQLEAELAGFSVEDKDSTVDSIADELAGTHLK
ncbi:RNI-like protein [Metschnikowia bicuspidata var. bicuspidata NRRL YB-4993]|uniref:RNI-like protein n=1 Tax=Metschnikowia bicuspidata var. bicuspidata NRRL YB-4993 TaxID=869754 RepID=A0A1A0H743_9ASCO|nr:RNI-like protein [Metschnikowia bicuspidata var. bicuspidata NRRL YB-4993]OBA19718.1 RNI-like protein [Metschnikowia bicuspidata var. bicuspidata NRRL YB-4993]